MGPVGPVLCQLQQTFREGKGDFFPITMDVKKMHERQNKLMALVFIGALCPKFFRARPNVINSSIIKSLENTYHFLREVVPSELQNKANVETQDRSALVIKSRTVGSRGRGSDFKGRGRERGCGGGGSGGQ